MEYRLLERLSENLVGFVPKFLNGVNRNCSTYVKGVRTQDKGINKSFENIVNHIVCTTLNQLECPYEPFVGDILSDVSYETPEFILQVDAKGCHIEDGDFTMKKDGFHGHCGVAQTSLQSTCLYTHRKTGIKHIQKGKQHAVFNGKPVYTFIAFMVWGHDISYFIQTCGVILLPHEPTDFKFKVGKSEDEMRWVVKNPELYRVHQFVSESPSQILDSTQSECRRDQASSPQLPSSPIQQMDQAPLPQVDNTP